MAEIDDTLDQISAQFVFLADAMKGHLREARDATSPEAREKAFAELLSSIDMIPEIVDGCRFIEDGA